MKKLLLTTAFMLIAMPAFAKEVIIKEVTEAASSATPAANSTMPQGTGKVVSVDAENHTIKLKHDPIKALDWPTMTMLFTADGSVDLSTIQEGDTVSFTLKPAGKDDYTISTIKKN